MRAVDTNVVARFLLADDAHQHQIAVALFGQPLFLPITVLLETAWLLSSRYGQPRDQVAATLATLVRIKTVSVANPAHVRWAIDRYRAGSDVADMLHCVASIGTTAFATFDQKILAAVGAHAPVMIETLG